MKNVLLRLAKKLATNVMRSLGRAMEKGAKVGSAAVCKLVLSTNADVVKCCHTGKEFYLGNFVQISF